MNKTPSRNRAAMITDGLATIPDHVRKATVPPRSSERCTSYSVRDRADSPDPEIRILATARPLTDDERDALSEDLATRWAHWGKNDV